MKKVTWTPEDMPALDDKIVVITGANSGLGLESARLMAARGAQIIMACRSQEKASAAKEDILDQVPDAKLDIMALDLASQKSIQLFAARFKQSYPRLDILMNNAGLMAPPLSHTEDGFEMQFGTNHLGHFALTGLLLDHLEKADAPRIITVSSVAHNVGNIYFDNLNAEKRYSRWFFYGQSKLANLVFARDLHRRLKAAGSKIQSFAVHPGYSDTNLQSTSGVNIFNRFFAQPQHIGCYPSLYAATSDEVRSGEYYGPNGHFELGGYPAKARVRKRAKKARLSQKLWKVSEEMTGVAYLSGL